jgi:multiple sugar transport system substrate-binding protein
MFYLAGWLACPHVTQCYVIWTFAENQEGAKRFLADMIDNFGAAFQASGFCNFPCFPKTAPDLLDKLSKDPKAEPRGKYKALRDARHWTRNLGHPGYATPATDEIFYSSLLPRMFAAVAKGEQSAGDAASAAEQEVTRIVNQWKQV